MRVLQLIDTLEAGGAERMAINIANALAEKVDSSHICSTRGEGLLKESINNNVKYLFLSKKSALDIKAILKLRNYVKNNSIDIIHAHSSSFFLAVIIKWSLKGEVKIIWHDHYGNSEFVATRKSFILKVFSKSFNYIIVVNKVLENWSKTYLQHKRVSYVSNFATLNTSEKSTLLRGKETKRIVCLANLRSQKDHGNLLKAFAIISKKYPEWTLHLVGKNFKDEYLQSVKRMICELELEKNVFYYGSKEDTTFILSQATIGVLSSKSEGLPLALLEYGLSKLPVVVTDVGECKMVVGSDLKEYFVVPPSKNIELSKGLIRLIEDEKLRKNTAISFHNRVVEYFSELSVASKLLNIYRLV